MKNSKLIFKLLIIFTFQVTTGQPFQKSFGKVDGTNNTDQQEFYDIINYTNETILNGGTFRNVTTFPEIAFYGTLSKIAKNGTINWYKGYLPSNFQPFDSFLIKSILSNENGEIFAVGSFLSLDVNSGYLLMKLNSEGQVLFSIKIKDEFTGFDPKLIMNDTHIFAILGNKIAKFTLDGELVKCISSFSLQFRDITLDSDGGIICVGDYNSSEPDSDVNVGLPVVRLNSDLDFINGTIFHSDTLGGIYAHSALSYSSDNTIIGGPSIYFSLDSNNNIKWAKKVPNNFQELPTSDSYGSFLDMKKDGEGNIFYVVTGFFSNDDSGIFEPTYQNQNEDTYFQYYTAMGKINPSNGNIIYSKEAKEGHFEFINQIELNSFIIDNNTIYGSGRTIDYYSEYHLNYLHKTAIEDLSCGEVSRTVTVEDIAPIINTIVLPSDTFSETEVIINSITMTQVDIPINYENQSCALALEVGENIFNNVTLAPNPSSSFITIEGLIEPTNIDVVDNLGRILKSFTSSNTNQYDISTLSEGIYYIRLTAENNDTLTLRLLKK